MSQNAESLKITLAAALGVIVTGLGAYVAQGSTVSRQELQEHVETAAPWVIDRAGVKAELRAHASDISSLTAAVSKIVTSQQELLVEQRVLIEQMRRLLDEGR